MLRFMIAALAVAATLYTWGELSSRVLPWPQIGSRRVVLTPAPPQATPIPPQASPNPSQAAQLVPLTPRVETIEDLPPIPSRSADTPPTTASDELIADSSSLWPLYAFQRNSSGLPTHWAASAYFVLNISIGVVAVLLVAIIQREKGSSQRRLALLGLVGLFFILLTDVTQGIWMEWPSQYIAVLCTDHFVAVLLAIGVATAVLFLFARFAPAQPASTNAT